MAANYLSQCSSQLKINDLPGCGDVSDLRNGPVGLGYVVGAWHPAFGYMLQWRMLVASISQKQWRNNALSSRCCREGECDHLLQLRALLKPSISLPLLTADCAVSVSLSNVFCFIICCKSFFEWHGRKEQTRLVAQCFKDTQVNCLSSSSGEVKCIVCSASSPSCFGFCTCAKSVLPRLWDFRDWSINKQMNSMNC